MEARVWMTMLRYWLKLFLFPLGLALGKIFNPHIKKAVTTKMSSLGSSPGFLLSIGYDQAKALIKQHIVDTEC